MPPISYEMLAGLVAGAASAVFGWIVGRRKTTAEATITELEAVQKAVGIWRETAEALTEDVENLRSEIALLRGEIETLRGINAQLKRHNDDLTKQVDELRILVQQKG
jgi:archaellum component FlaC